MVVTCHGQNMYQNYSSERKSETKYVCFIYAKFQQLLYLKGTWDMGSRTGWELLSQNNLVGPYVHHPVL